LVWKKIREHDPSIGAARYEMTNICNADSNYKLDVRQRGILLAALLAGSIMFSAEIKAKMDRRIFIINTTSNIAWAATAFLGTIPLQAMLLPVFKG